MEPVAMTLIATASEPNPLEARAHAILMAVASLGVKKTAGNTKPISAGRPGVSGGCQGRRPRACIVLLQHVVGGIHFLQRHVVAP